MPPLPPVPGIAKIIVKQTLASVAVYNILHARQAGGSAWTGSECAAMATAVRSAWVTNVIPLQSNALSLGDVQVIDLSSNTGNEGTATGTTAGGLVSAAAPANACVCWSWKIARRYRGGHPRTYIAGLAQANVLNANSITSAHRTAHAAAGAAIRNAIEGVTVGGALANMVVIHYRRDGVQLTVPDYSYISSVSVDDRIDSQRRRLGRDR